MKNLHPSSSPYGLPYCKELDVNIYRNLLQYAWTILYLFLNKYSFLLINLFIFIFFFKFMAVLGLRFCARAFSSCSKWGPLFIVVRGPLTIAASLVA